MRKTEFLQELREALDGEVSASVIQSNISYYDQYIRQEAAKGRREEEVIEEIGSPRLIAKTIIDSSEGAGETGQGGSYTSGDAAGAGAQRPPTTAVFRSGTTAVCRRTSITSI